MIAFLVISVAAAWLLVCWAILAPEAHYVVSVERRRNTGLEIEHTREYLVCIKWDPYGKGDDGRAPCYDEDRDIAFEFHTRAAAEMAAVWVGGVVEEYGHSEEYGEYAP